MCFFSFGFVLLLLSLLLFPSSSRPRFAPKRYGIHTRHDGRHGRGRVWAICLARCGCLVDAVCWPRPLALASPSFSSFAGRGSQARRWKKRSTHIVETIRLRRPHRHRRRKTLRLYKSSGCRLRYGDAEESGPKKFYVRRWTFGGACGALAASRFQSDGVRLRGRHQSESVFRSDPEVRL